MDSRVVVLLLCAIGSSLAYRHHHNHHHDHWDNNSNSSDNLIVQAPVGRIRGSMLKTRLGKDIYSFRGIRYGEPPVGSRRFEPPVPAADWSDEFDATQDGPSCPLLNGIQMSEDCLRLNVYTTKMPKARNPVKRPVIVFIHPGGFYGFSGQSYVFGPRYLMDQDIVLVVINYRLALLGFLALGDDVAPGNAALKDQVVALKWIKRNIAAFGGDPDNVTITGDSAGAWSVVFHMLSPMSTGLFHRGIVMSGSPLTPEPLPLDQRNIAIKQAEILGCPTTSSRDMIECFKQIPVENFTNTQPQFREFYGDPILVWSPVVEKAGPMSQRFVIDQPLDLIKQRRIVNEVPIITGITKDEFDGIASVFYQQVASGNTTLQDQYRDDWYTIAPISFQYQRNTPRSRYISSELAKFYFDDQPISLDNWRNLGYLYSDAIVITETHRFAQILAENTRQPVWFYEFTYQGPYSFAKWNNGTPFGVVHQDDLLYLFNIDFNFPFFDADAPEGAMIDRIGAIWSSFAYTGCPIPKNNPLIGNVTWDRFSPERDNYLEINLNPKMRTGLYSDRMELWERLYPVGLNPNLTEKFYNEKTYCDRRY